MKTTLITGAVRNTCLGIEVNEAEIAKCPYKPRMLRHYTGTLTDIRPKGDTFYFFEGFDRDTPVG